MAAVLTRCGIIGRKREITFLAIEFDLGFQLIGVVAAVVRKTRGWS